jgi:hypothetical protein
MQIGIVCQPAEIAVSQIDRFLQGIRRLKVPLGQAQTAGQVIENQ